MNEQPMMDRREKKKKRGSGKEKEVRLTQLEDSTLRSHVTVFLVHVVGSRSRVVTKPDSKVLNLEWRLLVKLGNEEDFTACPLHLDLVSHEIPEARLGNTLVGSIDGHLVNLWVPFSLTGLLSPHDNEFTKL
jgi:hypothetical protein